MGRVTLVGYGTKEAMNNASNFIKSIEDRQSLKISCLEKLHIENLDIEQLKKIAEIANEYGRYLKDYLKSIMRVKIKIFIVKNKIIKYATINRYLLNQYQQTDHH